MRAAQQSGFTLIELVMVIVILGILSAVAIPQFIDLRTEAREAAAQGVAGALSSASVINYAARSANPTKGVPIATCADVVNALQGGAAGYTIAGVFPACTAAHPDGGTPANFTAIAIP